LWKKQPPPPKLQKPEQNAEPIFGVRLEDATTTTTTTTGV
jgi:hypothetical protein